MKAKIGPAEVNAIENYISLVIRNLRAQALSLLAVLYTFGHVAMKEYLFQTCVWLSVQDRHMACLYIMCVWLTHCRRG